MHFYGTPVGRDRRTPLAWLGVLFSKTVMICFHWLCPWSVVVGELTLRRGGDHDTCLQASVWSSSKPGARRGRRTHSFLLLQGGRNHRGGVVSFSGREHHDLLAQVCPKALCWQGRQVFDERDLQVATRSV